MTVHTCPIEGCEYQHTNKNSLIAHMTGKSDEAHRGVGYQHAVEMLAERSAAQSGSEPEPTESGSDQPESASTSIKPEIPSAEENTESAQAGGSQEEPECPSCGESVYFEAEGTEYDYACAVCSTSDQWEVFNA